MNDAPLLPAPEPWRRQPFAVKREASWSRDGYNRDWRSIPAHEELTLADIRGSGCIARLWFALDNGGRIPPGQRLGVADPLFLRKTVLQIFWDDAADPSVEVPVGDFFGVGGGEVRSYSSALIEVSAHQGAGRGSLTSWIRMPFFEQARFVLRNDSELPVRVFWHIDYQRWDRLPADGYHFHANWRCELPCPATPLEADGSEGPNLTGEHNYVILDATGEGTYYGCHLTVDNHAGGWWGEGDDMVFVDGEPFPGSLHGTGQEEYFGQGWGNAGRAVPLLRHPPVQPWSRELGGPLVDVSLPRARPDPVPREHPRDPGARPQQPPRRRLFVDRVLVPEGALPGAVAARRGATPAA